ncbi:MAG: glycosyltransferase family 4 protein [Gemmatimonadota bacterium]|nr:glycosyltransferase family 4 protein [Gemmatimonadota bacterium]
MRILWLKSELLHPVDKGGRIRTYYMLRELRREHHVTYLALDDGDAAPDAVARSDEYCDTLIRVPFATTRKGTPAFYAELLRNLGSRLPYAIWKYQSPEMRTRIAQLSSRGEFDVMVCDFLAPAVNVPASVRCPTVLFQHNVEATIWERHTATARNPAARRYLRGQWRRMQQFEREQCHRFDQVIAVSVEDRDAMARDYGAVGVAAVPTGVDTAYYRSTGKLPRQPHELVFTGSMDWLPNQDGILHFVNQVLPSVRAAVPDVTLTVVGRNPPARIRELAERDPSVRVTGRVDDVRPFIERAAVFVVPLRIGGGTRLKIFEAMAMDRPVVSTTIGAEGLPVRDGEEILVADEPAELASAVVRLLNDPQMAARIGARGGTLVRGEFGWDRVADAFVEICARVAAPPPSTVTTRA